MQRNVGRLRQVAVVAAWVAAGLLIGGVMRLQVERMIQGDGSLWTQPSEF